MTAPTLRSSTRAVDPKLNQLLDALTAGERIRIVQTVRVGQKHWTTTVEGAFRGVQYLATGLAAQRPAAEEIVVPTIHFTKDNDELSSVAIDENTEVTRFESSGQKGI